MDLVLLAIGGSAVGYGLGPINETKFWIGFSGYMLALLTALSM